MSQQTFQPRCPALPFAQASLNWVFLPLTDGVLTNSAWADQIERKKYMLSYPEAIVPRCSFLHLDAWGQSPLR